ncbi:MAG: [FeFe] hydrogenase H-cluster radical maturase HydE, partial [Bacteroidetes bacterium]|nr:[FeFe] hydrogenase H-cluster radical maturase HydE [Bacteroidota bacterium]
MNVSEILIREPYTFEEIAYLLQAEDNEKAMLFEKAAKVKKVFVQNKVYLRGLIEFSNRCRKNCLYCGIRKDNIHIKRYSLTDEEILDAARFAFENRYGSVVLQSGERVGEAYTKRIERLLKKISRLSNGGLRVT